MQDTLLKQKTSSDFIRNFVFGVEDSLVSTIGLISGVAAAGMERDILIVTGVILVFVEAFSMAVGSLLSDNSVQEFDKQEFVPMKRSFGSSVVMFFSYFLSGFIILAPYVFLDTQKAFIVSIIVSLVALFILGFYTGKISGISVAKKGLTMMFVGGLAIFIGVSVGVILKSAFF